MSSSNMGLCFSTSGNVLVELTDKLSAFLDEGKVKEAEDLLADLPSSYSLASDGYRLIPFLCGYIKSTICEEHNDVFRFCEYILIQIVTVCKPEVDLVTELLEEIETDDDVRFACLLKVFSVLLPRFPKSNCQYLEWCLNAILLHLESVPEPIDYEVVDGKIDFKSSQCAERITCLFGDIEIFYMNFVSQVSLRNVTCRGMCNDYCPAIRDYLTNFILCCFSRPLAMLDMERENISESSKHIVETLIFNLNCINSDCFEFLRYLECNAFARNFDLHSSIEVHFKSYPDNQEIPALGLAVLYYAIVAERMGLEEAPQVYHPVYISRLCLYLSIFLLKNSENILQRKGLLLTWTAVYQLNKNSFAIEELEYPAHFTVLRALLSVVVYSTVEEYRKFALQILEYYLGKFDWNAQYVIITNLINTVKSSEVSGFLITKFKDICINVYGFYEDKLPTYFQGKCLFTLIKEICSLPNTVDNDVMESMSKIIPCLNVLRYFALRDKFNKTGLWNYHSEIKKIFLDPLKEGIIVSRDYYKNVLKDISEGKQIPGTNNSALSIIVQNQQIPGMSNEQIMISSNQALTTLDLAESLLSRVIECIENIVV